MKNSKSKLDHCDLGTCCGNVKCRHVPPRVRIGTARMLRGNTQVFTREVNIDSFSYYVVVGTVSRAINAHEAALRTEPTLFLLHERIHTNCTSCKFFGKYGQVVH